MPRRGVVRPADPRKGVWPTPDWLWKPLDALLHFDLDAAASAANAKCARFYTRHDDGLAQPWNARSVWCNPPYGADRGDTPGAGGVGGTGAWVDKAHAEVAFRGNRATLLVPVKADTRWYQHGVWGSENKVLDSARIQAARIRGRWYMLEHGPLYCVELLELESRISFGAKNTGFFASAVVLLNPGRCVVLPRLTEAA